MMMKRFCLFAACACLLVDMSYAQRKVEVVETPQNSQAATSEKVINVSSTKYKCLKIW